MNAVLRSAGERCGREGDADAAAAAADDDDDDDDDDDADDDDDGAAVDVDDVDAFASFINARIVATSWSATPTGRASSRCVNSTNASSSESPRVE